MLNLLFAMALDAAVSPEVSEEIMALGQTLYEEQCSACHGEDASGDSGPDIQGTPRVDVALAVKGFEDMPEIELTGEELDAVVAHLKRLSREALEEKQAVEGEGAGN